MVNTVGDMVFNVLILEALRYSEMKSFEGNIASRGIDAAVDYLKERLTDIPDLNGNYGPSLFQCGSFNDLTYLIEGRVYFKKSPEVSKELLEYDLKDFPLTSLEDMMNAASEFRLALEDPEYRRQDPSCHGIR